MLTANLTYFGILAIFQTILVQTKRRIFEKYLRPRSCRASIALSLFLHPAAIKEDEGSDEAQNGNDDSNHNFHSVVVKSLRRKLAININTSHFSRWVAINI